MKLKPVDLIYQMSQWEYFGVMVYVVLLLMLSACHPPSTASQPTTHQKKSVHLVETTVVHLNSLITTAVYTGSLRARQIVRIFTQEAGRITHLPYYEGDLVTQDTRLIQLDEALLRAEFAKTAAIHEQTQINVQRLQKLANQKLVSADELLRAQTEQKIAQAEENILRIRLSYTQMTAPFTGIVTARLVELGDVVSKNTHVLTVINPASLVVEVGVSEQVLSSIQLQDRVSVRIDALGTQHFNGYVARIHPIIDPQTRLAKIEVTLNPLPKGAREGQFCRVTIESQLAPRLTLPYSALRRDHEGEYVFVVDTNQIGQRQTVRSGRRLANQVEILEGLKPGQTVIVKGFLNLHSGQVVQPVNQSLQ